MGYKCSIPGCNKQKGHRFPKDEKMRDLWCVAVNRLEKKDGTLWKPKSGKEIVCKSHFLPSDFRPGYGIPGELTVIYVYFDYL